METVWTLTTHDDAAALIASLDPDQTFDAAWTFWNAPEQRRTLRGVSAAEIAAALHAEPTLDGIQTQQTSAIGVVGMTLPRVPGARPTAGQLVICWPSGAVPI